MKIKWIFGTFTIFLLPFLLRPSLRAATDIRPTPDDTAIMAAVVDKMIRPEVVKLDDRKPTAHLLIFDRTKSLCRPGDAAIRRVMGCLGPGSGSEVEKISTIFRNELQDPVRSDDLGQLSTPSFS